MTNWYPGHMAKAKRKLKEDLKLIDLVLEMIDARIPASSKNPDFEEFIKGKEKIIILNKRDLASKEVTKRWKKYFEKESQVIALNSKEGKGINELLEIINIKQKKLFKKAEKKGKRNKKIRIMVLGIPNVGKSALINALGKRARAKTGDRPGITRGKQWINIKKNVVLLDTPGLLWPMIEDESRAYRLAVTGAIDIKQFDEERVAYQLLKDIINHNPEIIMDNYKIDINGMHPYDVFLEIGKKRGCLMSGGKVDKNRVSKLFIKDFQKGKLGAFTLENP
ncbi:MAG: ribosome biogenesis GTPase YlqF [Halanaerobiales bacterium]